MCHLKRQIWYLVLSVKRWPAETFFMNKNSRMSGPCRIWASLAVDSTLDPLTLVMLSNRSKSAMISLYRDGLEGR